MTKYHVDDTVAREKARLVVKGFTQVYGANYDKTYVPMSSYVTLRILGIWTASSAPRRRPGRLDGILGA
ncbi:unnamed protein product [Closterium sp. NIES-54]